MTTEQRIKEILETARSNGGVIVTVSDTDRYRNVFLSGHITSTSKAMTDLLGISHGDVFYTVDKMDTYVLNEDTVKLTVLLQLRSR